MANLTKVCAREHHKRSTSSATLLPHNDGSPPPAAAAVLENRKSVIQNRRSASERKASDAADETGRTRPAAQEIGLLLLSTAQSLHLSGEDPVKAQRYALKAAQYLERTGEGSVVELVMSLHLLAATLCKLGQYEEAIQVLERSVLVSLSGPNLDPELAHASFSGFMQLGDTYFMVGQYDAAVSSYESGLHVQKQVLGASDLQVADTCRYVAESYLQLMEFKEAEELCGQALKIHREKRKDGNSDEEVSARRVMALIHSAKGENEAALEQLLLASMALSSLPSSTPAATPSSQLSPTIVEVGFLDASIGDAYLALGRFEEAVLSYEKALAVFKLVYGEGHTAVGSINISLADLYLKRAMFREAKHHCEKALVVYGKVGMNSAEETAIGLSGVAGLFESMGEVKHSLSLLQKAWEILLGSCSTEHQHQKDVITSGIEAQMGVLLRLTGKHEEAYVMLRNAISKYRSVGIQRSSGGSNSIMVGMLLNQMGLACVGLNAIWEAADAFEESRSIFQQVCGVHHSHTLDVCVNLAGAYDAMGRVDHAINLLENVVEVKENRLGTAHPDVEHARQWLAEMLKETGRSRSHKTHTLHDLLLLQKAGDAAANVKPR